MPFFLKIRNNSAAFRQAPSPIASARPACFSGPMNARFMSWVAARVTMPIFTGVTMFCLA